MLRFYGFLTAFFVISCRLTMKNASEMTRNSWRKDLEHGGRGLSTRGETDRRAIKRGGEGHEYALHPFWFVFFECLENRKTTYIIMHKTGGPHAYPRGEEPPTDTVYMVFQITCRT